jgi:predicted nucleotide-binding protein
VIVDVSAPNLNVYFELGLCNAIGKDCRVLKQAGVKLPADLAGIHYIEYSLSDVVTARRKLTKELSAWAKVNDLTPIKAEKAKGLRKPRSNAARR